MTDIKSDLDRLAATLPEPSDLVSVVMSRIPAEHRRPWFRPVLGPAVALLAIVVVVAVIPGTRRAVADLLGIGSVEVVFTDRLEVIAGDLSLGERAIDSPIDVPLPPSLDEPAAVYVDERSIVTFIWPVSEELPETTLAGVGALVSAVPGVFDVGFRKTVDPDTVVRQTRVNGARALWIEGDHQIAVRTRGEVLFDTVRLASNTLVWQVGDVTVRFESALDEAAAVAVAESMTAAG